MLSPFDNAGFIFYFTFAVGSPFDPSENFYNYILSISLYHHLVKRERFLQDNYIIPATHPLCDAIKIFNFSSPHFKYKKIACSPFEHARKIFNIFHTYIYIVAHRYHLPCGKTFSQNK